MACVDEYQDLGSHRPLDRVDCIGLCADSVGSLTSHPNGIKCGSAPKVGIDIVAGIQLDEVTPEMLLRAMLLAALHAAPEDREITVEGVDSCQPNVGRLPEAPAPPSPSMASTAGTGSASITSRAASTAISDKVASR
jgi:hypothetical protein